MFGMGMGELLLIMVVALLVVGPDKLPQAAKAIGKGIRDFRRHTHDLQSTLEQDENLGEAVRELRSALRDDPIRPRPSPRPPGSLPGTAPSAAVPPSPGAEPASSLPASSSPASPPAIVPAVGTIAKGSTAPAKTDAVATGGEPAGPAEPRDGTTSDSRADDPAHG